MSLIRVLRDPLSNSYELSGGKNGFIKKANDYLKTLQTRGLSQYTLRAYAYDLLFIFKWLTQARRSFKRFSQKDLVALTQYQQMKQAKPRSINRRLTSCEAFFRFCYDTPIVHLKGMSYPNTYYKGLPRDRKLGLFRSRKKSRLKFRVKVPRTLIDSLEPQEIHQFLEGISRYRDLAIVFLMLFCGLRASEVLSLKLQDVDFIQKQMRIHGKGGKERILPLSEDVGIALTNYLRFERPSQCQSKAFFVILQGKRKSLPMSYAGLRSLFRYHRKVSGISKANPHRFRHAFGTSMARQGVSLPALQKMMGHSDFQITLQYINLSTQDIDSQYHQAIQNMKAQYEKL